ncbi:hypothetical protein ACP8Y2_01650 [Herpetosiphon llansteffanensis]
MQLSMRQWRWLGIGLVVFGIGLWWLGTTSRRQQPRIIIGNPPVATPLATVAIGSQVLTTTNSLDLIGYQQPISFTAEPRLLPASQIKQHWLVTNQLPGEIHRNTLLVWLEQANGTTTFERLLELEPETDFSLLPDGHSLLMYDREQVRLFDLQANHIRWHIPLEQFPAWVTLVVDAEGTGLYLLAPAFGVTESQFQVRHFGLADGQERSPVWRFSKPDPSTLIQLAANGSIWLIEAHQMTHVTAQGRSDPIPIWSRKMTLDETGQLGVAFTAPNQALVFNPMTGEQIKLLTLAGAMPNAYSEIQINPRTYQLGLTFRYHAFSPDYLAIYDLNDGAVLAFEESNDQLFMIPQASHWARVRDNRLYNWNLATNQMEFVWAANGYSWFWNHKRVWQLANPPAVPLKLDQTTVTSLLIEQLPAPTPSPEPKNLLPQLPISDLPIGLGLQTQAEQQNLVQLFGDGSTFQLQTNILASWPRRAQAPLYVANPQPQRLSFFDAEYQTLQEINLEPAVGFDPTRFQAILRSDQSVLISAFYDFSTSDQFTGTWQVARVDRNANQIEVLLDSNMWPKLPALQLKAASEHQIYFVDSEQRFWRYNRLRAKPQQLKDVANLQVSLDRQTMVTLDAQQYEDRRLKVWNLTTEVSQSLKIPPFDVANAQLSPDAQALIGYQQPSVFDGGWLVVYRFADQQLLRFSPDTHFNAITPLAVHWSHDGRYLGINTHQFATSMFGGDVIVEPAPNSYYLYDLVTMGEVYHGAPYPPVVAVNANQLVRYDSQLLQVYQIAAQQAQLIQKNSMITLDPTTLYLYPR